MSNLTGRSLKLIESPLDAIVAGLRAKATAAKAELAASLEPIVDDIEIALAAEHAELEDIRRLRRLVKLREAAARAHAARVGRLLSKAKRQVPHGQFQEWVAKQNFGVGPVSEYIRAAKQWKIAP